MPRPPRRADHRTRRRIPSNPRLTRAVGLGKGAHPATTRPQPLESEGIGGYGVDPGPGRVAGRTRANPR